MNETSVRISPKFPGLADIKATEGQERIKRELYYFPHSNYFSALDINHQTPRWFFKINCLKDVCSEKTKLPVVFL